MKIPDRVRHVLSAISGLAGYVAVVVTAIPAWNVQFLGTDVFTAAGLIAGGIGIILGTNKMGDPFKTTKSEDLTDEY